MSASDSIENGASDADFWSEVDKSLVQILSNGKTEKDKANFSIDRQAGMVTVYGNSVQQASVDSYFQNLKRKAYAQVLIDARIIEVELDDEFKSGINWNTLFSHGLNIGATFTPAAAISPTNSFAASVNVTDFSGMIDLVRSFGTTRVLSSPRLTVLNNQTAVLKVATNQVYFVTQALSGGCHFDPDDVTYYVGHETVLHRIDGSGLPEWQEAIFAAMERNSSHVSDYFNLPRDRVVEIGRQVEI